MVRETVGHDRDVVAIDRDVRVAGEGLTPVVLRSSTGGAPCWHMNTLDQNAEIADTIPEPVDDLDPLVDLLTILVRTEILERRVLVRVDFDAIGTNDLFVVGIDGEGPDPFARELDAPDLEEEAEGDGVGDARIMLDVQLGGFPFHRIVDMDDVHVPPAMGCADPGVRIDAHLVPIHRDGEQGVVVRRPSRPLWSLGEEDPIQRPMMRFD